MEVAIPDPSDTEEIPADPPEPTPDMGAERSNELGAQEGLLGEGPPRRREKSESDVPQGREGTRKGQIWRGERPVVRPAECNKGKR